MSKSVRIPQSVFFALGGLLILSLVAVAYLFGRQNAAAQAVTPSPVRSPQLIPLPEQAEKTLDSRVGDLEDRIGTLSKRSAAQSPTGNSSQTVSESSLQEKKQVPQELADLEARRAYFDKLNEILGSSALSDSQPMATRLLERVMSSNEDDRFESALSHTTLAAASVEDLNPPVSCREHKELILKHLQFSQILLHKVQASLNAGDTTQLEMLSEVDDKRLSEFVRLRDLDRQLRPQ